MSVAFASARPRGKGEVTQQTIQKVGGVPRAEGGAGAGVRARGRDAGSQRARGANKAGAQPMPSPRRAPPAPRHQPAPRWAGAAVGVLDAGSRDLGMVSEGPCPRASRAQCGPAAFGHRAPRTGA